MLLEILSLSLPMTALILLLGLLSRIVGNRFTAKCRYVIWTLVFLRLCLPFGTVHLPSLVQVSLTAETAETAETVGLETTSPEGEKTETPILVYTAETDETTDVSEPYTTFDPVVLSTATEEIDAEQLYKFSPAEPEGNPEPAVETLEPVVEPAETLPDIPAEPDVQEPVIAPVPETEPSEAKTPAADNELTSPLDTVLTVLCIVWLAGAFAYTGVKIASYNWYTARLRKNAVDAPPDVRHIHEHLCKKYGIRRPPELQISPDVHSPMLYGYFRPCVILPEMELTENQTVGILAHELTHYRRRDLWIKLACVIGCSLHWFNPAAHFAAARCHAEMELSCDEAVLAGLDEEARRSYGNVMLDIVRWCQCSRKNLSLSTHFNPKKNAVRERFLNIMDMSKKKQGFAAVLAAAVLCSLAGMVFAYETEPPSEGEGYLKINDRVSIRIGSGVGGTYAEVPTPEETADEPEAVSEPVEEIYERGGLEIPVLSEMVEHVTVPEQTDKDVLINFYHTASLENGEVDPDGIGWLFSIERHDYDSLVRDDVNYGGIQYFAVEPNNSYFYCIRRPTDIRWDPANEVLAEEYARLAQLAETIAQRVLADNDLVPFTGSDIPGILHLRHDTTPQVSNPTYPSPDYLARLEYSIQYGWLVRGEGAGANGVAIGDSTRTGDCWAEWVSDTCCRLYDGGKVIDLFRKGAGWTTEESAYELTFENNMPVWVKKADFTETADIFRKAYYGALKTDEFLSMPVVQEYFAEQCNAFLEPFRTQGQATVHGNPDYVPDGAVLPDKVTWDMLTVTESESDEYDYLLTLPLGDEMHLRMEVILSDGTHLLHLGFNNAQFCLTEPIIAEEGNLREIIVGLVEDKRTDYYAEIHIPDAENAVLTVSVEGEGIDLHDLKDVYCTEFSAHGQTIKFKIPLDLWGIWSMHIFAAEDAVVLSRHYSSYSGNTYVITPKYTYEYHPGTFSLMLYEENNDLRYRHSSNMLCDAAVDSSILGIATSRDNFYYECGDVKLNGGKFEFYEPDEYYTIDDAFDLDAEFEKNWKSETFPTIESLFLYNGERYGAAYDYPTPDETPLPELLPAVYEPAVPTAPVLPLAPAAVPKTFDADSYYIQKETTEKNTNAYTMTRLTDASDGEQLTSTIFIPQLKIETAVTEQWNREIYERLRDAYAFIPYEYETFETNDWFVTVTYDEFTMDGVVSIPITFRESIRVDGKTKSLYRAEVYHYDKKADAFLTNEEYLLRITDGKFDYETLLDSLNEQNFNFVLNGKEEPLTLDDIYGILPSNLDENGFDVYMTNKGSRNPLNAVHWREYPVFTSSEGIRITYRLMRYIGGYKLFTCIDDPRELPVLTENQSERMTSQKVYKGDMFELTYGESAYSDYIYSNITYTNEEGARCEKKMAHGNSPSSEYYFQEYLNGTYSMTLLMEHTQWVPSDASFLIVDILRSYYEGGKPFEAAPDVPQGVTMPTPSSINSDEAIASFVETGNPALPFKFTVPITDNCTMDIYWNITDAYEMVAEKIEFRQ